MQEGKQKGGKRLTEQAQTGERGISFIYDVVTSMGCGWHPTNHPVEVGIDGDIELVDPVTREATNSIIRVQSRATVRRFTAETETSFEYLCTERELDYWMSGNAPVILIVSRPHTKEGYWVSIKDYFADARVRKARKVVFDKAAMRFDKECLSALFKIAADRSKGLYIAPPLRRETLYTNLLHVTRRPETLWLAETDLRRRREVFDRLLAVGSDLPEFALSNRRILAAHDLRQPQWSTVVDQGTVEEFPASEWADSNDQEKRNLYAELLAYCLGARARQLEIVLARTDGELKLWFAPTPDLSARTVPYRSVKESSERTVFQAYRYTRGPRVGEISYYRHFACDVRFRRYDSDWYLELNPTYRYTIDGQFKHPLAHEFLAGMKRQEKQGAIMYQVVLWASVLRGADEGDDPYWATNAYPHLAFGPLRTFELDAGINDDAWLPNEDPETELAGERTLGELPLFFQEPNPYSDEPNNKSDED